MPAEMSPIRTAVVGYGYWGPNIVRNLLERPEFELATICDREESRRDAFLRRHPGFRVDTDFETVLGDPEIDAVSIATPPRTHFEMVKAALEAGKHVLVEKPLATTEDDARELIAVADERGLTLMPGHTFLYSPPVNKVRELIESGVMGEIYFVTSSRMNLGIYQSDGVVCDLAPHDLSILLYWLNEPVVQVTASGRSIFNRGVPETAFLTLTFAGGTTANIQISWLAPRKVRQMVVVGSKRMIQYEDTSADEAVRIYDRGLELRQPENFGEYRMTYRSGDMVAPRIEPEEPLSLELEDFAHAIHTGAEPRSHSRLGLEIVRVLEAAEQSLQNHGQPSVLGLDLSPAASGNGNGNGHRQPALIGARGPQPKLVGPEESPTPFSRWRERLRNGVR
jgi:predicted dehydrogenase